MWAYKEGSLLEDFPKSTDELGFPEQPLFSISMQDYDGNDRPLLFGVRNYLWSSRVTFHLSPSFIVVVIIITFVSVLIEISCTAACSGSHIVSSYHYHTYHFNHHNNHRHNPYPHYTHYDHHRHYHQLHRRRRLCHHHPTGISIIIPILIITIIGIVI